jgi:hypothetical protein
MALSNAIHRLIGRKSDAMLGIWAAKHFCGIEIHLARRAPAEWDQGAFRGGQG